MTDDDQYLFPLGLTVRHGTPTSPLYQIVDRRITQRDLFGGLPEYLLAGEGEAHLWCAEADIWPLDAEA